MDNKERINTTKGTQSTYFSVQSVKITFILFKYQRCIDNSSHFYLLSCHEKANENEELICENAKPGCESQIATC